ncbi:Iron uptake system component EfeO [Frankia sp. AiPs1]|uniref:iron uptake system protein EfeO n=1 Tax=Frankia sp. AiPa1 TaxID=573492 RepID=UPI00202B6301|nr:iron uptake system protein EfeO [Frankia sp. AiPa1]MCL9761326.1 iron uptake system protein EfeO [Frankia sp. AiPa1]
MRRAPVAYSAIAIVIATGAVACGGSDSGSSGDSGAGEKQSVTVTLTSKGCSPSVSSIPAGPTTFTVTNKDAGAVTEAELMKGDTILGEKENIAPGLSGTFSLNVRAGKYQLYCPGGSGPERVDFTVTAAASAAAATLSPQVTADLRTATTGYATYVRQQVADLVRNTGAFVSAVKASDLDQAAKLYPAPRLDYEAIEPVAESFGDLDPAIDARIDDEPDVSKWTGFHRLEKAIFADRSLAGMSPIADQLNTDVGKLNTLVATVSFQPAQIANGATELLNEVGQSKITGEEERYSKLDLVDMQGNIDGADKAFTLLEPALKTLDPKLATTVRTQFTAMYKALEPYKKGDGYVAYDTVTESQRRALSQAVDALAEPLSQVAGVVVS